MAKKSEVVLLPRRTTAAMPCKFLFGAVSIVVLVAVIYDADILVFLRSFQRCEPALDRYIVAVNSTAEQGHKDGSSSLTSQQRDDAVDDRSPEGSERAGLVRQQEQSGGGNYKGIPFAIGETEMSCDIFDGEWIYDEASRPLYQERDCPYIRDQLSCQAHGRPDSAYQHWRWQPRHCSLPSFDAASFMEALRGKRMLFIGDSLSHGHFDSMLCLLHPAIGSDNSRDINDLHHIFRAKKYNATIEFFWAPFLVEAEYQRNARGEKIIQPETISKLSERWKGVDIMVFNSYGWWTIDPVVKVLTPDSSLEGGVYIREMQRDDAYRLVMKRMIKWLEENMDPRTTRILFTGVSPTHKTAKDWGGDPEGNCYNETTMITDKSYWGSGTYKSTIKVIMEEFSKSRVPISYIDITQLSEYRRDAHPMTYKAYWIKPSPEEMKDPRRYSDCIHWCLPGVHDTWNELLYTMLFYPKVDLFTTRHQLVHEKGDIIPQNTNFSPMKGENVLPPFAIGRTDRKCDIFDGEWVYDEATRPLYQEGDCPYIRDQLSCQAHGRPDHAYQHWRWQPHKCSLPSFNPWIFMEALRGKRMLFIGDSLSHGHFDSMLCLLHPAIGSENSREVNDLHHVFRAEKYNATLEFFWAPFLVEAEYQRNARGEKIIQPETISKLAERWKGVDIMVFNSYGWWTIDPVVKVLTPNSSHEGGIYIREMGRDDAYRLVMKRMIKWLEENMDPRTTRVLFTGVSPTHKKAIDWGGDPEGNCYNETTIIQDKSYWGSGTYKSTIQVIKEEFSKSKVPINYIDITQLSEYRRDAHPMTYKAYWIKPSPEEMKDPRRYSDCIHWCLPGVHDTWNELLYTMLFYPRENFS